MQPVTKSLVHHTLQFIGYRLWKGSDETACCASDELDSQCDGKAYEFLHLLENQGH